MTVGANIKHYKILSRIGEGGMGVVYLAEDTTLHRKIALKLLSEEFTKDKVRADSRFPPCSSALVFLSAIF